MHDIKMIVDNSTLDSIGGSHAPHHSYSSSTSAAHATPSTAFPHLPKPYVVGELNSVTYDKFFGPTKVQAAASDVKDQDLLDFINEGYTEPGNNYAKSYRNIQVLPKGTLFVTVSVHEYLREGNGEGGAYRRPVQLCRYDLLLKEEIKVQRLRPIHLQKLGYKHLSGPELERACRQYSMLSFSLAKPYLLIPYSRANAELKLTLSEVQDWPKAEVKGQCAFNIAYYVTRHRVVSMVQSLGSCSFSDLPAQEEGGKLNLVMSRAPVSPSSSPTRPVSRLMRDTAASRGGSAELEAGRGGRKKKGGREYSHALLSWTLITMGYSEVNEVGFLMTLNQVCVLLFASITISMCCNLHFTIGYCHNTIGSGVFN
ncbi:hypothetical protein EON64_03355 [archaeon]|nr:MAG: hypothetical protein EON64_03355 [archaeon]